MSGHMSKISSGTCSRRGSRISSCAGYGICRLLATDTGKEVLRFKRQATLQVVAFAPDGKRVISADYTAQNGSSLVSWPLNPAVESRQFGPRIGTNSLAFSPEGNTLATGNDCGVHLWDESSGAERRALAGPQGFVKTLAFSPDGRLLAAGGSSGPLHPLRIWQLASGKELWFLHPGQSHVSCLAFSPDGRTLVTGGLDAT